MDIICKSRESVIIALLEVSNTIFVALPPIKKIPLNVLPVASISLIQQQKNIKSRRILK
jgi:hypothetical protein